MLKLKYLFQYSVVLLLFTISLYGGDNSRLGGENGEQWHIGKNVHIWWEAEKITSPSVNLYLWDGTESKLIKIAENIKNTTASFDWLIPESINPGNLYKIKIVSTENTRNFIMSENFFSIYNKLSTKEQNPGYTVNDISIFPNPASDYIYIPNYEHISEFNYTIFDLLGQEIQSGIIKANIIDISSLSPGFYCIKFTSPQNSQTISKFVKH